MSRTKKNFIQSMDLNKGALHRALGVPSSKKIPTAKLEKATHSKNSHLKKMAVLADNFRNMKHK